MKSCSVTIHMKATTSPLLNTPYPRSVLPIQCWQITEQLCGPEGRGREEEGKRRLKVVAFPTLVTIGSDFSMLSNTLF